MDKLIQNFAHFNFMIENEAHTHNSIKLQNILFSVSKSHNSKNRKSRVTVLAFCMSPMMVNIYMKFHEDILNIFSYKVGMIESQNLLLSVSKHHNSKNRHLNVTVLAFWMSSNVG